MSRGKKTIRHVTTATIATDMIFVFFYKNYTEFLTCAGQ